MTVLIRPLLPASARGEFVGPQRQRVGAERGDAGHLRRVVDQPHRQPLLRAGLGEVETEALVGLARVVQVHPQRDRPLARFQRRRGELVRPAQPAGPRQMGDQVQLARLQPEVLAPAVGAGDGLPVQRRDRRVERLEHREGRHVDAPDGQPDGVPAQVVGQRFDLGKFGHTAIIGLLPALPTATAPSSRSTRRSRPRLRSTRSRRSAGPSAWSRG